MMQVLVRPPRESRSSLVSLLSLHQAVAAVGAVVHVLEGVPRKALVSWPSQHLAEFNSTTWAQSGNGVA